MSDRIPKENFYRRLKDALNLDFLYPLTEKFYGQSGQKSIDPIVFSRSAWWDILRIFLLMYLTAIAYNLKKYLKHTTKPAKSGAGQFTLLLSLKNVTGELNKLFLSQLNFSTCEQD